MARWLTLRSWLRTIVRRSRVEGEIDEELRFHVQEEIEAGVRRGMTPDDARRAAYASLGGPPTIVREECRDQRGVSLVEDFTRDLGHGARFLRRNRGFAVLSMLTLAISHRLWQRMFGGDAGVLGQTLLSDFGPATISVMPPTYRMLDADVDLWPQRPPSA